MTMSTSSISSVSRIDASAGTGQKAFSIYSLAHAERLQRANERDAKTKNLLSKAAARQRKEKERQRAEMESRAMGQADPVVVRLASTAEHTAMKLDTIRAMRAVDRSEAEKRLAYEVKVGRIRGRSAIAAARKKLKADLKGGLEKIVR